jgi:DNA-binding NtrC family response regulator
VLGGRRTLLFVNRAWETLTGVPLAQARGQVCRRRREPEPNSLEPLLHVLAPPPEALAGKTVRLRRLIPGAGSGPRWWDITFLPLAGEQGLRGILGRVSPVSVDEAATTPLLPERLAGLREKARQAYSLEALDSERPALRRLAEQVRLAASSAIPVLLLGEPGTGKEWVARTIHQESSGRERAFAAVECGRLGVEVLEALLFNPAGLAWAGVGTVFLKEPQRLPREQQAKLLGLLEVASSSGKAGQLRFLAGSSAEPGEEVRAGRLLPELYLALSTLTISLPPLRERMQELPTFVERMLARLAETDEPGPKRLSGEALEILQGYAWPGNLTELQGVLAEAAGRAAAADIQPGDLPLYLRNPAPAPERNLPLDTLLEQVERRLILLALRKARNNKTRAAEILAIWRPRLLRRMEALGIKDESDEEPGEDESEPPVA